jgi:hypothetical protein
MIRQWMVQHLYRWSGDRRLRVISDGGVPYLERYYLGTRFGIRCYLHRFVGSDPDRGLHDHPWSWAGSIVLAGFYQEQRDGGTRTIRRFNWLRGSTFHRVLLPESMSEVWTLFFHRAQNTKSWGFRPPGGAIIRIASGDNRRDWWLDAPLASDHPGRTPERAREPASQN